MLLTVDMLEWEMAMLIPDFSLLMWEEIWNEHGSAQDAMCISAVYMIYMYIQGMRGLYRLRHRGLSALQVEYMLISHKCMI